MGRGASNFTARKEKGRYERFFRFQSLKEQISYLELYAISSYQQFAWEVYVQNSMEKYKFAAYEIYFTLERWRKMLLQFTVGKASIRPFAETKQLQITAP
jgi:hypothetical protein